VFCSKLLHNSQIATAASNSLDQHDLLLEDIISSIWRLTSQYASCVCDCVMHSHPSHAFVHLLSWGNLLHSPNASAKNKQACNMKQQILNDTCTTVDQNEIKPSLPPIGYQHTILQHACDCVVVSAQNEGCKLHIQSAVSQLLFWTATKCLKSLDL